MSRHYVHHRYDKRNLFLTELEIFSIPDLEVLVLQSAVYSTTKLNRIKQKYLQFCILYFIFCILYSVFVILNPGGNLPHRVWPVWRHDLLWRFIQASFHWPGRRQRFHFTNSIAFSQTSELDNYIWWWWSSNHQRVIIIMIRHLLLGLPYRLVEHSAPTHLNWWSQRWGRWWWLWSLTKDVDDNIDDYKEEEWGTYVNMWWSISEKDDDLAKWKKICVTQ